MQEMTATKWRRGGSSIVWHPDLLSDLIRDVEPISLRVLMSWHASGFPESPPGGSKTVLVGGLQTVVEVVMQAQTPDVAADWLRAHILSIVRALKTHWPNVGLVFVMDGPGMMFEFNEGNELVYFGKGRDRVKKVRISQAIWNGAASGAGAYQLIAERPSTSKAGGGREVGGYHVGWMS